MNAYMSLPKVVVTAAFNQTTSLPFLKMYMATPSMFMANFIIGLLDKNGYNGGDLW
jgi:ATP/ADP translocase